MCDNRKILAVDIGNTAAKVILFHGETPVRAFAVSRSCADELEELFSLHEFDGVAFCCVGDDKSGIGEYLERKCEVPVLRLSHSTPLPIGVEHYSFETLGLDRIAGAVGASGRGTVLVADAGTALTLDLVSDGKFLGGNISPGLRLRCESLHRSTSLLPLVDYHGEVSVWGHDTLSAIRAGAVRGLEYEIIGAFRRACRQFPDARLILTGGDAPQIHPLLSEDGIECRVSPDLVGLGLVRIFNFNNPETSSKE